ncbi:MAG: 16S rRNA (cytosine(967)-C(5))-methyltransferase RsmB [Solirubrobacteraceae bacterium]
MSVLQASTVSPARSCAFAVVRRVFEQGAYADRAFTARAQGLPTRERSLAMALAYGTVQRRATLDHIVAQMIRRPLAGLDPPVLAALRLGCFELLFLGGSVAHAAVNESVELVKLARGGGAGLVNAVLRRISREGRAILDGMSDGTPAAAAIKHSVPQWLAEQWWEEIGAAPARALLAQINHPAESALRVNTLTSSLAEVLAQLPVDAHPAPGLPDAVVVEEPFDAHGSELWSAGRIMPQSRASMLVARILDPQAGERVLDLCAAPGAKTTQLAALMHGEGEVVAVERHRARADGLARTCERMRAGCVHVEARDATAPRPPDEPRFARVLVDPPCSGLGTLQSRPDIRWRATPEKIVEMAALQGEILGAGAMATARGGILVYSVCTIARAEGEEVIEAFLRAHPDFRAQEVRSPLPVRASPGPGPDHWMGTPVGGERPRSPYVQLLPHLHATDGFFIARLRRA